MLILHCYFCGSLTSAPKDTNPEYYYYCIPLASCPPSADSPRLPLMYYDTNCALQVVWLPEAEWCGHLRVTRAHEIKLLKCTPSCPFYQPSDVRERPHQASTFTDTQWLCSWLDMPGASCSQVSSSWLITLLQATHSALFFLSLRISSQPRIRLCSLILPVQNCYLCAGLICSNASFTSRTFRPLLSYQGQGQAPPWRIYSLSMLQRCILFHKATGQEMPHSFSSLNQF